MSREDQRAAAPDKPPTNEERILSVLRDAAEGTRKGYGDVLTLTDIVARTGIAAASVYLSSLGKKGLVVRAGRAKYRLRREGEQPQALSIVPELTDDKTNIDDQAAIDIRADERRRIAALLPQAIRDAVPKEPMEYLQGFIDGANFVAERVLGETVDVDLSAEQ